MIPLPSYMAFWGIGFSFICHSIKDCRISCPWKSLTCWVDYLLCSQLVEEWTWSTEPIQVIGLEQAFLLKWVFCFDLQSDQYGILNRASDFKLSSHLAALYATLTSFHPVSRLCRTLVGTMYLLRKPKELATHLWRSLVRTPEMAHRLMYS